MLIVAYSDWYDSGARDVTRGEEETEDGEMNCIREAESVSGEEGEKKRRARTSSEREDKESEEQRQQSMGKLEREITSVSSDHIFDHVWSALSHIGNQND